MVAVCLLGVELDAGHGVDDVRRHDEVVQSPALVLHLHICAVAPMRLEVKTVRKCGVNSQVSTKKCNYMGRVTGIGHECGTYYTHTCLRLARIFLRLSTYQKV